MTYEEAYAAARDEAQLIELDRATKKFIDRFKKFKHEGRQTVFLFPGGLGSQLKRSQKRYEEGDCPDPSTYKCVWLNGDTFIGAALYLRMKRVNGVYMEDDEFIVIAGETVEFLGCTPYDRFVRWCRRRPIDLFIYGYDWRRPLDDTASFFVTQFLPRFRRQVMEACDGADPLLNFSLVGHCLGGMLVNWMLRTNHSNVAQARLAITVATPFYGYAGQVGRWFAGEPMLNHLGKLEIVRVISSFPALYTVNFLDVATYLANKSALEDDASEGLYPLRSYPSTDAETGENADPYNPQTKPGPLVRYPSQAVTGFGPYELARGHALALFLAEPIRCGSLSAKFFNIRGVLRRRRGSTIGSTCWGWVHPDFDPTSDASPIKNGPKVPGDGTQPAFTTRLVRQDEDEQRNNIITVKGFDVEHVFIMNSRGILAKLAGVLGVRTARKKTKTKTLPRTASSKDALKFVRDLQKYFENKKLSPLEVSEAELKFFLNEQKLPLESLRSIARRIMIDLLEPLPTRRSGRKRQATAARARRRSTKS